MAKKITIFLNPRLLLKEVALVLVRSLSRTR